MATERPIDITPPSHVSEPLSEMLARLAPREAEMGAVKSSTTIGKLAAALAKAQARIGHASKDATNPHFKSSYATLASVLDACREALAANEIAVFQPASAEGAKVTVATMLVHSSGEWISTPLTVTAQQSTPQGIGSAITYARRYGLSAMVGVGAEDDDGNSASQPLRSPTKAPPETKKRGPSIPDRIESVKTIEELKAIAPDIKKLPVPEQEPLKALYMARYNEIAPPKGPKQERQPGSDDEAA